MKQERKLVFKVMSKVLIIDDEEIVQRALARAFSKFGHEVEVAADAFDGKRKWSSFEPDIVLLDILMPEKTGPEMLLEIKKENKIGDCKIVLMSAFTGHFDSKNYKHKGAHMFIPKPFENVLEMVKSIEGLIE